MANCFKECIVHISPVECKQVTSFIVSRDHPLSCKTSSFDTNLYEVIHLKIINYLTDKKIPMKSLFEKIETHYKQSYNIDINYQLFCNIIEMIIDDYNDYYLNDEYYYDGYWYDGKWYNYPEENEFENL
jgi:hypothetical protein